MRGMGLHAKSARLGIGSNVRLTNSGVYPAVTVGSFLVVHDPLSIFLSVAPLL